MRTRLPGSAPCPKDGRWNATRTPFAARRSRQNVCRHNSPFLELAPRPVRCCRSSMRDTEIYRRDEASAANKMLVPCNLEEEAACAGKRHLLGRLLINVGTPTYNRAVVAVLNSFHNPLGPVYTYSWQLGWCCPEMRLLQKRKESISLI